MSSESVAGASISVTSAIPSTVDPRAGIASDVQRAFDVALAGALAREARDDDRADDRYVDGKLVVWAPQAGSQERFISCPMFEVLFQGTRGPGKTDALLMDFAQHVGPARPGARAGFGPAWRGILFRRTFPELADVVAKSQRWFRRIFPGARFNHQRMAWEFETGEVLLLRYISSPDDYWRYHGHEYPWIGFEELTSWADSTCFTKMFSCCRSTNPDVPRKIRATTNPYGVGMGWVKLRYRLAGKWWQTVITDDSVGNDGNLEPPRCAIYGHLSENKILLAADPNYRQTIAASASNPEMARAWLAGDWDVIAGGFFSDVFTSANIVPRFAIPPTWRIDRSFDWGSARPFSVGWWAESDGSDLQMPDGSVRSTVRRDLFRLFEWYGWNGKPNEGTRSLAIDVAAGIVEREIIAGFRQVGGNTSRVQPGPADSSIYTIENGRSIGLDMEKPVRIGNFVYPGVRWTHADKRPGSRAAGWEQMRAMIAAAKPKPGQVRERPALFIVGELCPNFLRTVPQLVRDEKNPDDIDTDGEDHIADEARYRVRTLGTEARSGTTIGMH